MKKKRILFIMHMPPPTHGAAQMGKYIHDSELINEKFDCCYVNPSVSTKVGDVGKFNWSKVWHSFYILYAIIFNLIIHKPNLCYYTATTGEGPGVYMNVVIISILKLFRKKIVLHLHNKGCKRALTFGQKYHYAYKFMFRNAYVILLSPNLYKDVENYVKKENVFYCPNGIPAFEILTTKKTDKANRPPHLLFLSNLLISKGILVLLDALEILSNRQCSYSCHIVGDETQEITSKDINQEIQKRSLQDNVYYLGRKIGLEKENEYANCDIFVFPTLEETFGIVILEAMQHKKPVIATIEGGIPDIIENDITGMLVQKDDCKELANKIQELMYDEQKMANMGQCAYQKFIQKYTVIKYEERMYNILTTLTIE